MFFLAIVSSEFESVEETEKLETDIGIAGLMETGKILDFEWSLSTKLDVGLEFALQIARQALEQRLLAELEEKDETFFTGAQLLSKHFCLQLFFSLRLSFFTVY